MSLANHEGGGESPAGSHPREPADGPGQPVAHNTAGLRAVMEQLEKEISFREEVETKLRDGRARLEAILDTAVDAIITIDERGAIESFNPAAARLFDYEAEEVIGTNINRLMPSPYQESHDGYLASYLRTGEKKIIGIGREVTGKRKDDSVFPMDLSISEVVLGSRRIFTGIVRDVTERKRFEAELHQHIQGLKEAQQLTERQGEHMREQAEELAAQNKELEQFAYVTSHDLQEPLRMIRSYTQLLTKRYKGRLDGEADEFISFVEGAVDRMQQLITDLLSYSSVGRKGKEFGSVDCETCVARSLANLSIALEETGATVERSALPQIFGDSTQLTQLFQNLIGNALKYRAQVTPRIEVRAERQGREWLLAVSDNGVGIAPEHNERIFGMFQRLHGREEYPGTGIGLAICKKIVDQHGGRIWLESQPGQGSKFFFTLPAIEDRQ